MTDAAPARAFIPLNIAVLTVSDTRSLADDKSGATLADRLTAAGLLPGGGPLSVLAEVDVYADLLALAERIGVNVVGGK